MEVHTTVVSLPPTYDVKQLCESAAEPASSSEYMNKIRKRLNEDSSARVEREKRRRKVLVEQLTAHQALEVRCTALFELFYLRELLRSELTYLLTSVLVQHVNAPWLLRSVGQCSLLQKCTNMSPDVILDRHC